MLSRRARNPDAKLPFSTAYWGCVCGRSLRYCLVSDPRSRPQARWPSTHAISALIPVLPLLLNGLHELIQLSKLLIW